MELRQLDRELETGYGNEDSSGITWYAEDPGAYFVLVGAAPSSVSGTGSYTLTVSLSNIEDDHANNTVSATTITVGEAVAGAVEYESDVDFFRFPAEEGVLYEVAVTLGTLDHSYLQLRNDDGWYMDTNNIFPAPRVAWAARESGDVYVLVGSSWQSSIGTGNYTLTVALSTIVDDEDSDTRNATSIAVGEAVAGNLWYVNDIDYFSFTAEKGMVYQIDVVLGTLHSSYLELRDNDNRRLRYNNNFGGTLASRIIWEALESGDVYVVVSGPNSYSESATGSYTLALAFSDIKDDHTNDTVGATAIAVGAIAAGALEYEGDVDYFRFTAEEGVLYQIDVALDTLHDSYLELRDIDDVWTLAEDYDLRDSQASPSIVWQAPESAEFYVVVGAYWSSPNLPGSYTLTVTLSTTADDHANFLESATTIALGETAVGTLEYEGDIDFFVFTAGAGEGNFYQISAAPGSLDDSYLELRGDDGRWLAKDDGFAPSRPLIIWTAAELGNLHIVVGAGQESATGTGSYTLTITLLET
ncbi:MAG: hypothetical protein F4X20_01185 [Dehalococcoidia bacterium]|nr:hypothetical protein [Dehalococcoidia bacterium]